MTQQERPPEQHFQDDQVLPFQVDGLDVRGRLVRLGPVISDILDRHHYPAPVARLVAEAVALTVLLGSAFKQAERLTIQTRSDGPVGMVVADMMTPDKIRACAQFDESRLGAVSPGALPGQLVGHGHMAITIEQGDPITRYQGLVALHNDTLEQAALRYFEQSEQIPARIRLAVAEEFDRGDDGPVHSWRAGGMLIQFLPESAERMRRADLDPGDAPEGTPRHVIVEDDAWVEAVSLLTTLQDVELIDPALSSERLLYRLFHEQGVRIFPAQTVKAQCSCSRGKLWSVISGFSSQDREDMVENGVIRATCAFCSMVYIYKPDEFSTPPEPRQD